DLISLLRIFGTAIANSIAQARERELRKDITQLENTLSGIIEALSSSVAMRDSYTAGHQRDVAKIAGELAERLGYSSERTKNIHTAGLLHDIGKVSIPPAILNETGELGDQEFEIIQRHPRDGYEILSGIDFRGPVAEIVLQHHERLDGTGYPRGLTSTEILPEAKILAVADSFEAMTSHRPYRPAYSVDRTLTIMEEEQRSGEGSPKYDPDVLRALKELVDEGEVPV
ncbi:MAG: HD-GYP domain-containing protein, partial [Candidatus Bipolaricaulota bacterium]